MARRVLFWCYADAREVVEVDDDATDDEIKEAFEGWMGNVDSGWNDIDKRTPSGTDEVDHG